MTLQPIHPLRFDAAAIGRPNYVSRGPSHPTLPDGAQRSSARAAADNELLFTRPEHNEIAKAVDLFRSQGRRSAAVCYDEAGAGIAELLLAEFARNDLPPPIITTSPDSASVAQGRDGLFFAIEDAGKLSASLARLADMRDLFVWAPKTPHYFMSRPVFVQSVPKCGTHVVFECLKAFGYAEPPSLDLPDFAAPLENGVFYNLQHMPISCLSSPYRKFPHFINSLSRSVTVFIVRDPRDLAVSLAYYLASQTDYHISTALFRGMSTDERINRVLTGDYPIPVYLNRYLNLGGTIRELFEPYLAWWRDTFPNVWRLRYEDVIGASGGGDSEKQLQTVWELQLALHVPGRPGDYCKRIFCRNALTFRRGQIGDYLNDFSPDHHKLFQQSAGHLLEVLGYGDRWKIARAFSVRLPQTHQSSAMVASQLRSELASRGRDFSSITVHSDGERDFTGLDNTLDVEARRIGDSISEDEIQLSIELCDTPRSTMPGLVSGNGHRYCLRVRQTSAPQSLVKAIIEALVRLGCVERLSEDEFRRNPNSSFTGEIHAVASAPDSDAAEQNSPPHASLPGAGQDRQGLHIRSSIRRWLQSGQSRAYSSAQVD